MLDVLDFKAGIAGGALDNEEEVAPEEAMQ